MSDSDSNHKANGDGRKGLVEIKRAVREPGECPGAMTVFKTRRKYIELLTIPGVPLAARMVMVYGVLRLYADRDRKVRATHAMLAAKSGLRTGRCVGRLLRRLRDLRLVEWRRGACFNTYSVFEPDVEWISARQAEISGGRA